MKKIKLGILGVITALAFFGTSCNKELEQLAETPITPATGPSLDDLMRANPNDSLYYRMISRVGGLTTVLDDTAKFHTLFVTSNNGLKPVLSALAAQAGVTLPVNAPDAVFSGFISQLPIQVVSGLVAYNTVPQKVMSTDIRGGFPNFIYPTILNPSPSTQTLLGPVVRLAVYPSTTNGAWLNNVPLAAVDDVASNGVVHHTATMSVPPQRYLWDRINADPELTYLKAAIQRADSGVVASQSLQGYLSSFGPDFTIFAPVDTAFKSTLTALIAQGLITQGFPAPIAIQVATGFASTPAVFTNPLLANTLTPANVKGILVYHVLGVRAYTNNFGTTVTAYPTLLNSVLTTHPGLKIKTTFNAPNPFVASMTVKDVYNNSPAANVILNTSPLLPDPIGTSDQSFVNGVLHKIDRVLLPQ
jgi:hypothetical protein